MFRILFAVAVILVGAYGVVTHDSRQNVRLSNGAKEWVPTITTDDVLSLIRQGKRVVFIDAREHQEWQEEHIPGAINIPLREIASLDRKILGDPDVVIAYCLKDFRGFEVAKALQNIGVHNASILVELGINGWKEKGLPTVVASVSSEQSAGVRLLACARGAEKCGEKAL